MTVLALLVGVALGVALSYWRARSYLRDATDRAFLSGWAGALRSEDERSPSVSPAL